MSNPSPPPQAPDPDHRPYRYHRPQNLDPDLFLSHEDVGSTAIPTPPYQRVPSTSQVLLESYPEQSPAYRSRSNVDLSAPDMSSESHIDEKHPDDSPKGKQAAVHYVDELDDPPRTHRFDTIPQSRASSIAGTDEEDSEDEYDWSGEEDLVDEEAKFEQAMGVKKKKKGWGFSRCVLRLLSALGVTDDCAQNRNSSVLHSHRLHYPLRPNHHPRSPRPLLLVRAPSRRPPPLR